MNHKTSRKWKILDEMLIFKLDILNTETTSIYCNLQYFILKIQIVILFLNDRTTKD